MSNETIPSFVPVFRREEDIPNSAGVLRRHSYRTFDDGKGKGRWSLSKPTAQTLAETRWAPDGKRFPPKRYSVQFFQENGKPLTPPMLIDENAEPQAGEQSPARYRSKVLKHHVGQSRKRFLASTGDMKTPKPAGPLRLLRQSLEDATAALGKLSDAQVEMKKDRVSIKHQRTCDEVRGLLRKIVESCEAAAAKIRH